MIPSGFYYIDGKDLGSTFGMFIESGTDDFLKMPKRKDSITHDWQDSNGIEIDTSRVFFEPRDIQLKLGIIATSRDDFWKQHNSFLAQIAQPGLRRLTITEHDRSYFVIYKECVSYERFTRLKDVNKIGCKFTITITELNPEVDYSQVFIVDEEGRFLVT